MSVVYPHLHFVILCNEPSETLWPLTRGSSPRDLLVLSGDDSSLISRLVEAALPLCDTPIHVVCSSERLDVYRAHLLAPASDEQAGGTGDEQPDQGGFPTDRIDFITVPTHRGDTFALALVVSYLRRIDPEAMVIALRSGIHFTADEIWEGAVARLYQTASENEIALLGRHLVDADARTHGQLMRSGAALDAATDVYRCVSYHEDAGDAPGMRADDPRTYQFCGISAMRATFMLSELHEMRDDRNAGAGSALDGARIAEMAGFLASLGREYWSQPDAREVIANLPDLPIGKSLFEPSQHVAVVETSLDWTDITSLSSLAALAPSDAQGNTLFGHAMAPGSHDTTVFGGRRLVVACGLDDAVVVDTPDVTLVASAEQLADSETWFSDLEAKGLPELEHGPVSQRSWGTIETLHEEDAYSIVRLEVVPGRTTPFQTSSGISEQLTAVSGRGTLYLGDEMFRLAGRESHVAQPETSWAVEADEGGRPLVVIVIRMKERQ